MCGIAGLFLYPEATADDLQSAVVQMSDEIRHRGPDTSGHFLDVPNGLALSHRRLAILETGEAGFQPMHSASGRYTIVYNGEIYNHVDLRRELANEASAPQWSGASDTETLLACIDAWGLEKAVDRICGMFAFAIWDRAEARLSLVRDRVGEKPLYYVPYRGGVAFSSQLKALIGLPGFARDLDRRAVASFVRFGYVPEPLAIFANVSKVPAGTVVEISAERRIAAPRPYWSLRDLAIASRQRGAVRNEPFETLSLDLENLLEKVVESQMISDVPIGAFLSGGIDSTLITLLMTRAAAGRTRTFSLGFDESRFDESHHAARIARHLGTAHTEIRVTERDALDFIPEIPLIYDEPFADPSQIPTVLLSRMARTDVTVALTGDGGDEIFGGYNRHVMAPQLWRLLSTLPHGWRRAIDPLAREVQIRGEGDRSVLRKVIDALGLPVTLIDKCARLGHTVAQARTLSDVHLGLESAFDDPGSVLVSPPSMATGFDIIAPHDDLSPRDVMLLVDTLRYLPGDILTKVDRAAMSTSLETRAPLLDRRVIEASWSLPSTARISGRIGKRILRDILKRHVPEALTDRPKQGFTIPIDQWLRGGLKDWGAAVLEPRALNDTGVFRADVINRLWEGHQLRRENHGLKLWHIAMFEAWYATYMRH